MTYSKFLTTAATLAMMTACSPSPENTSQSAEENEALGVIHPELWPALDPLPLNPAIESRIDEIMAKMTLEQKVGQTIQADSASVTPDEVREYRLGSVLSGGNSAPGPLSYADAATWLEAADAYYEASIDTTGVEVAIPIIWGIDAVHGHANLTGATIFPHNVGLGATQNPDLIEEIARVTARELIVSGHDWTFAPTLAVPRDDRWGRTYEGFSESPEITRSYADRIVFGLQGRLDDDSFMGSEQVISAAKHFLADGGTENGADQGDAKISEAELRDIHGVGYLPALEAGVQSVMASFSSWQGVKMTGNKALLTDVLKDRMGFQGFVVSDWNAHGQIPGCSNTDCPQAFNAGIDMFMAPDSWRGLYESTLAHARSGRITEERLNDAVRRILRVKLQSGLFEKNAPSKRHLAGDTSLLGSDEHRAVARQAVRESLVLLKNDNKLLPLNPASRILVIGDGADSIAKAAGGWTLSWQGGTHTNDEFPNGQSILAGIEDAVRSAGGEVIFDPTGNTDAEADVVIAVYGENAYAEFQGDRANVDFETDDFDTERLAYFKERGTPVVSVFISGRPLWTNPEINDSTAFVAAWLPGSEGAGVADLLFRTDPAFDFTGRLAYSWPRSATQNEINVGDPDYDPQFAYGYGLNFSSTSNLDALSENSGLSEGGVVNTDTFFTLGQPAKPWSLFANVDDTDTRLTDIPWDGGKLKVSKTDRTAQEDSLRLDWTAPGPDMRIATFTNVDLTRQTNGAMELAFFAKTFGDTPLQLNIGMGCGDEGDCRATVPVTISSPDWAEHRINLSCFAREGLDMASIGEAFYITSNGAASVGLSEIRLESDTDATETCGDAN